MLMESRWRQHGESDVIALIGKLMPSCKDEKGVIPSILKRSPH